MSWTRCGQGVLDVLVIGGGISGLYAAYRLLQQRPSARVFIAEAGDRLGGRAHDVLFQTSLGPIEVHTGAAVGRCARDYSLRALCHELGVLGHGCLESGRLRHSSSRENDTWHQRALQRLWEKAAETLARSHEARARVPFEQFLVSTLGARGARRFMEDLGYTDYMGADALDTLQDYGLEYAFGPAASHVFQVPWNRLVAALATRVKQMSAEIHLQTRVLALSDEAGRWVTVALRRGPGGPLLLRARAVVAAIPPRELALLFPEHQKLYLRGFVFNEFIRIYAEVRVPCPRTRRAMSALLPTGKLVHTSASNDLQKVLVLKRSTDDSRVAMLIAYADSDHARRLQSARELLLSTAPGLFADLLSGLLVDHLLDHLQRLDNQDKRIPTAAARPELKLRVRASSLVICHWPVGTHGFSPLPAQYAGDRDAFLRRAQHPRHRVLAVGEALSRSQGWTQGALESVHLALQNQATRWSRILQLRNYSTTPESTILSRGPKIPGRGLQLSHIRRRETA